LDVAPKTKELALRVMSEMLLGERFTSKHFVKVASLYSDVTKGLFSIPVDLPFTTFGKW
jgi:hypothetical protein